jgi:hypothetical protein
VLLVLEDFVMLALNCCGDVYVGSSLQHLVAFVARWQLSCTRRRCPALLLPAVDPHLLRVTGLLLVEDGLARDLGDLQGLPRAFFKVKATTSPLVSACLATDLQLLLIGEYLLLLKIS